MALHEIVYVSLACEDMTAEQLQVLLRVCRAHNELAGISGVLIYCEREFLQLLEGEASEVKALFDRIADDRQHQQIYKLWDEPISKRSYGDWSMAFVDPALIEAVPQAVSPAWLGQGLRASMKDASTGKKLLLKLRDELLERDSHRSNG